MNPESILAGTASLFLALGDKTRLRLLNLMRDREVCVSSFTGALGQSQPLISRHLAYLRNSGIVEARRDGKWIHYSISSSLDDNSSRLLIELFKWMELQAGLQVDRERYFLMSGEAPPTPARKREPREKKMKARTAGNRQSLERQIFEAGVFEEPAPQPTTQHHEADDYPPARHNELEDFLL